MILEILTPEKKLYSGEATLVQLPGIEGLFELLDNHAPLISALKSGILKYKTSEGEKKLNITGGFVECLNNKVIVCAEGVAA
ncbi:MAG: ATP synthase F1 subunit epsilon [Bacteroidetes bacterium]|nr:ATP synthase F1 subunit epsilon [Bacteroidota bacterium]MBK8658305.1 ATP synthase F1 subunit epsilon [Bacteroidota bacterium]